MHRPNLPEIPGQAEGRQAGRAGASTTPIPLRSSARYMGAEGWRPRPDSGFLDDGDQGMSTMTSDMIRARPVTTAALAIALIGAVTIAGAWFFQYGLGLKPCPLCLEQRYAYYFAIPLAVMVALGDPRFFFGAPARGQGGARRPGRRLAQGAHGRARRHHARHAVERRPRRLSFRHRMEVVAGPAGMLGRARRSRLRRRPAQQAAVDLGGALRRGGLALPRALARRLQRDHLARARRHRRLGGEDGMADGRAFRALAPARVAPRCVAPRRFVI